MPNHWLSRVQTCKNVHTETHAWWMGCVTFLQFPKKQKQKKKEREWRQNKQRREEREEWEALEGDG